MPRYLHAVPRGTFTPVRRNVGLYTDRGGTIGWLASADALVMVDSQFPDTVVPCRDGLRERSDHRLDRLINTHHHGDHTGGNAALAGEAVHIVAHRNVPDLQRAAAERSGGGEPTTADLTFEEHWEEEIGDEIVRLRYFGPAHTGGDAIVQFERADVVHMGDLVFNRIPPYIDVPGGASTEGWITVLEKAHETFSDSTVFVFGHGNPAFGVTGSRADLLVMRDFLSALIEHVRAGLGDGLAVDDIASIDRLPAFPDHVNPDRPTGLQGAIRAVHADLTRNP